MEQKFDLIPCTEFQKPVFVAQQLRGAAGAWYANLMAMQPAGVPLTWTKFRTAFRVHYIPEGVTRFGVKGKLAPRYIGQFQILERYGKVAYRLKLPEHLSAVHDVFHVSQLKKCLRVPEQNVEVEGVELEPDLTYSEYPIQVLD